MQNDHNAGSVLSSALSDCTGITTNTERMDWEIKILISLLGKIRFEDILGLIEKKSDNKKIEILINLSRHSFIKNRMIETNEILEYCYKLIIPKLESLDGYVLEDFAQELISQGKIDYLNIILKNFSFDSSREIDIQSKLSVYYYNQVNYNKSSEILDEILKGRKYGGWKWFELSEAFYLNNRIDEICSRENICYLSAAQLFWKDNDEINALKYLERYRESIGILTPKSTMVSALSLEYARQGMHEQSIEVISILKDAESDGYLTDQNGCFMRIAIFYFETNQYELALKISKYIKRSSTLTKTFFEFGKAYYKLNKTVNIDSLLLFITNDESKKHFLYGIIESVELDNYSELFVFQLLNLSYSFTDLIEIILINHVVYKIFLSGGSQPQSGSVLENKFYGFKHFVNWKNDFFKEAILARSSTNLTEWLHEISDEDDKEEVLVWAKKVSKGKMTEQEFGEKVKSIE